MISQTPATPSDTEQPTPHAVVLARYGVSPQVARFGVTEQLFQECESQWNHGARLVLTTERGEELGELLEVVHQGVLAEQKPVTGFVERLASESDQDNYERLKEQSDNQYAAWDERLREWQLQLQLIDLEWTLDEKQLILYVLNAQDAETTRLALLAAAAGHGIVTVQPVGTEGVIQVSSGGCGSGGCGSGGCGS